MTRRPGPRAPGSSRTLLLLAASVSLGLGQAACGRYGPPVRQPPVEAVTQPPTAAPDEDDAEAGDDAPVTQAPGPGATR